MLLIELYIFSFTLSLSLSLACSHPLFSHPRYLSIHTIHTLCVLLGFHIETTCHFFDCTCSENGKMLPTDAAAAVRQSLLLILPVSRNIHLLSTRTHNPSLRSGLKLKWHIWNGIEARGMRVHNIISLWAQNDKECEQGGKTYKMTNMWSFVYRFFIDNEWKKVVNNFIILSLIPSLNCAAKSCCFCSLTSVV